MDVARNDPCPCGSGKKYKKCCLGKEDGATRRLQARALLIGGSLLVLAVVLWVTVGPALGKVMAGLAVVSAGAYLLFADPPSSKGGGSPGAIRFGR